MNEQPRKPESPDFTAWIDQSAILMEPTPPTIVIHGADRQPMVSIHPDGTLEYGPDYDPDEAARTFWDALRHYLPAHCPNCGQVARQVDTAPPKPAPGGGP